VTGRKQRGWSGGRNQYADVYDYRYLGTTVGPANTNAKEGTRQEVRKTLVQVIRTIGRIPCLSNEQMSKCMSVAVSGIVGYWGRSTPLRMDDMQAAEAARAVAVQQRRFTPGTPHLQIYANVSDGGLQHEHAYRMAAAALVDQVDRAMCGAEGEPHRAAGKSAMRQVSWRLGCRGGRRRSSGCRGT
jgi:hypothetical protein